MGFGEGILNLLPEIAGEFSQGGFSILLGGIDHHNSAVCGGIAVGIRADGAKRADRQRPGRHARSRTGGGGGSAGVDGRRRAAGGIGG